MITLKLQYLTTKYPNIKLLISQLDLTTPPNTQATKIDNRIRGWINEFANAPNPRQVQRSPFLLPNGSECPQIFRTTPSIAIWIKNNNFTL